MRCAAVPPFPRGLFVSILFVQRGLAGPGTVFSGSYGGFVKPCELPRQIIDPFQLYDDISSVSSHFFYATGQDRRVGNS